MEKDLVSVIFATRNRKEDLIKCINSIYNSSYKKIEVVIMNNSSTDGSSEMIKKNFPDVILLESKYNLGVPVAFNKCIRKSNGEFIFRLDDDVILDKDSIKFLVHILKLKINDKIGGVSCLYFYTETPDILRGTGVTFNMWLGKTFTHHKGKKYNNQFYNRELERDSLGGGGLLTRRSIYDEVGYCSEEYFLMYEDVDLCYRIRKKGYKLCVYGNTKLYHKKGGGMSQKKDSLRIYLNERSRVIFMKRYASYRNFVFFPYLFLILCPIKIIRYLFERNLKGISGLIKGIYDGLFNEKVFVYTNEGKQIPYDEIQEQNNKQEIK